MQEDSEAAKDREAKKEMIYHTGNLYQRYKDRKSNPDQAPDIKEE